MYKKVIKCENDRDVDSFLGYLHEAHGGLSDIPLVEGENRLMTAREREILLARQTGHIEGYNDGYHAGKVVGAIEARRNGQWETDGLLEQQSQEFNSMLQRVESDLYQAIQTWFGKAETELQNIAVVIAERLVRRELKMDPDLILDIVRNTLCEFTHAKEARILLNPSDARQLMGRSDEIITKIGALNHIEIVEDDSIGSGCLIQTDTGSLDARIETHLKELIEEITKP